MTLENWLMGFDKKKLQRRISIMKVIVDNSLSNSMVAFKKWYLKELLYMTFTDTFFLCSMAVGSCWLQLNFFLASTWIWTMTDFSWVKKASIVIERNSGKISLFELSKTKFYRYYRTNCNVQQQTYSTVEVFLIRTSYIQYSIVVCYLL